MNYVLICKDLIGDTIALSFEADSQSQTMDRIKNELWLKDIKIDSIEFTNVWEGNIIIECGHDNFKKYFFEIFRVI